MKLYYNSIVHSDWLFSKELCGKKKGTLTMESHWFSEPCLGWTYYFHSVTLQFIQKQYILLSFLYSCFHDTILY